MPTTGTKYVYLLSLLDPVADFLGTAQVRIYYLDEKFKLCEYRFAKGKWYKGSLDTMNVECDRFTSIAAFQYQDIVGRHIRVYCQGWFLSAG